MKIAVFSTNFYKNPPIKNLVPPLWVSHYLTRELIKKGHKVFLFGPSNTKTSAVLVSNNKPSLCSNKKWLSLYLRLDKRWQQIMKESYEFPLLVKLCEMAQKNRFDLIQLHSSIEALYLIALSVKIPIFFTLHNRFGYPFKTNTLKLLFKSFEETKIKNVHFIATSENQRKGLPELNYAATIYHGIDTKIFSFSNKKDDYLAFAGRLVPEKGAHIAIKLALATGNKLKIAGQIYHDHLDYWNKKIKPHLSKNITYEGSFSGKKLVKFYQKAKVFLMTAENFGGIVVLEAQSCGTPVIGFSKNTDLKRIIQGKTGFLVNRKDGFSALKRALNKISQIKPEDCRKHIEKNFSIEKMTENYEKTYYNVLKKFKQKNKYPVLG